MDNPNNLGSCCICESEEKVFNLIMLPYKGPPGSNGWGCVACNLPPQGAMAVICEKCGYDLIENNEDFQLTISQKVKFIVGGSGPQDNIRVPFDVSKAEVFDHNYSLHPEVTLQ